MVPHMETLKDFYTFRRFPDIKYDKKTVPRGLFAALLLSALCYSAKVTKQGFMQ